MKPHCNNPNCNCTRKPGPNGWVECSCSMQCLLSMPHSNDIDVSSLSDKRYYMILKNK